MEITKAEAGAYAKASKMARGLILDRLVAEMGWSWANGRRQLGRVFKRRGPARTVVPRSRDTVKVLHQVRAVAGQPCGKYLAAVMEVTLTNLEAPAAMGSFGKAHSR